MSVETQCHIGCLVVNKVAGKLAKPFQVEVERLINSNGIEWTTSRLKSIWTAALHLRNGDKETAIGIYRDNSIAYRKRDAIPKGVFGSAVRNFLKARSPSTIRRWAAVLRFYTGLRIPNGKTTLAQYSKAKRSITSSPRLGPKEPSLKEGFRLHVRRYIRRHGLKKPVVDWSYSDASYLRGTSRYYSSIAVPKDIRNVPYASMTMSLLANPWVPPELSRDTPCEEARLWDLEHLKVPDPYVGKITFLQEAGCKARVVAQPTAYLQLAFLPLKKCLKDFTEKYFHKYSCVTHQTDGAWFALNSLNEGKNLYSVDLSSATDRFPLTWQQVVLEELGLSQYSTALEKVATSPWKAVPRPAENRYETFVYAAGQPMGLNGSFDLFNLTNVLLCNFSASLAAQSLIMAGNDKDKTLREMSNSYRVLGDDVIFNSQLVANNYRSILGQLGVETQQAKCFSGRVGEFAGFVLLPCRNGNTTCFRPYKVPTREFVTNPAEFLHALGLKASKLSRKWEQRFEDYRHTLPRLDLDLSPLDPKEDARCVATFRADISWVQSLANRIRGQVSDLLPDSMVDQNGKPMTRVNRTPLFRERAMFDWYGFNPDSYRRTDISEYEKERGLGVIQASRSMNSHFWKEWRAPIVTLDVALTALSQSARNELSDEKQNHPKTSVAAQGITSPERGIRPSSDGPIRSERSYKGR